MKSYTEIEKRKLTYNQKLPDSSHLDLPEIYKNKISQVEHKRVK